LNATGIELLNAAGIELFKPETRNQKLFKPFKPFKPETLPPRLITYSPLTIFF
jgi:hypothetical protein